MAKNTQVLEESGRLRDQIIDMKKKESQNPKNI
jgi:hypothetical protein